MIHLCDSNAIKLDMITTYKNIYIQLKKFSSVQLLSCVWFFVTPWIAARQASPSIINSQSLPKLISIEPVMPFNHLILCIPFSSCLQSFPASGSFPVSQFFTSGGQSIGASASSSVLPMNIQDWFCLGLTSLIFVVQVFLKCFWIENENKNGYMSEFLENNNIITMGHRVKSELRGKFIALNLIQIELKEWK